MKEQNDQEDILEKLLSDPQFEEYVLNPTFQNTTFWESWLSEHPEHTKIFFLAKEMLRTIQYHKNIPAPNSKALYEKIEANIKVNTKHLKQQRQIWLYAGTAATFALLITFSILYLLPVSSPEFLEYRTQAKTRKISLPDGSQVILNTQSLLRITADWKKNGRREAYLEGEGFFEIKKLSLDTDKIKFVVNTSDVRVEVLGTSFNVNTRQTASSIVLKSGSVKLSLLNSPKKQEITLTPGEMARFDTNSQNFQKQRVEVEEYLAWKDQELIFNQTALAQVVQTLEEVYGYEVIIQDSSLLEERLVGAFPRNDSQILLETLRTMMDIEQRGQTLIMKQKK